jgi:hypothetical protein
MKKIIHAAGLLTAGVATFCTPDSALADDSGRRWSVGATVKGFYDDNIFTAPDNDSLPPGTPSRKLASWGMDLSPYVNLNLPLDQTTIALGVQYGARWFEARPDDEWDQSFQVNGTLSHNFNARLKLDVTESFALAQEPEQLAAPGTPGSLFLRANGDNIRNNAGLNLSIQLSRPLSLVVGFQNNIYDYDDPGYSSTLNRIEYIPSLNLRYQFAQSTYGVLGYQCAFVDYEGDVIPPGVAGYPFGFDPSVRDNRSHYVFAGVDHNFTPRLMASLRGGAQITEYYDNRIDETATTPYFDASLSYAYASRSSVQVGVRHTLNATDVNYNAFNPTLDQESTAVYASVNHAFTAKFSGAIVGLYQNSEFNGGGAGIDGEDENYWSVGVSLTYKITHWMAAEANYYHDDLDSNLSGLFAGAGDARSYERNRVFFGFRFSY